MPDDERAVRELAYRLWEARGRPDGTSEQDWRDAQRQLADGESTDDALKATFPASDPPASQLPDNPPANAQAKWQAAEAARSEPAPRPSVRRRTPAQSQSKSAE